MSENMNEEEINEVYRVVLLDDTASDFPDRATAMSYANEVGDFEAIVKVKVKPYESLRRKAKAIRKAKADLVFASLDALSKKPDDVELILKASGVGSSAILKKAKSKNILIPPATEKRLLELKRVSPTWMNKNSASAEKPRSTRKRNS